MNNFPHTFIIIGFLLLNVGTMRPTKGWAVSYLLIDSLPPVPSHSKISKYSKDILGIWATIGDENSTFVIDKKKITYPQSFRSFPYFLSKDTLTIQYDDYEGIFLVRMRSADTLVLTSDEKQIFYRFKK